LSERMGGPDEKKTIVGKSPVDLMCESSERLLILLCLLALVPAAPCPAQPGPVFCWGDYARDSYHPVPGNNYVAVCAGGYHGLALTADGKLVAWGENIRGQCNAPLGGGFTAIAAGLYHNLALKRDGSLVVWGDNSHGQCDAPKDRRFRAIAAGSWHSLAICADGSLVAWGWNDQGQCNVPPGNNYTSVSGGHSHSVALRADGSLVAWGRNSDGQCDVPHGNDFIQVAAGSLHNVALRSDGTLVAWGRSYESQCRVPEGNDFVAVAAGSTHSLALTRDGNLVAWGHNDNAQCDVSSNDRFAVIAAGGSHSLAIRGHRVMPVDAPEGKAVAQEGREAVDRAAAKTTVSSGPMSATGRNPANVNPGAERVMPAPPVPAARANAGADSLKSSKQDRPPLSAKQESSLPAKQEPNLPAKQESHARPADSAAPLVLKHTTPDRTVPSVPPSGLGTPAAREPRVAGLVGAPGTARPAPLPKSESKMPPRTTLGNPGPAKNVPGKSAVALPPRPQGQATAAPATDETLSGRAQAVYDSLFEQGHFHGVLSWVGRPIDLIAIVVFLTCMVSILALLFFK
jgi:hypothetical protein